MSSTVNFVIRDGLSGDIPDCLQLDHGYETDYVWQMQVNHDEGWRIDFKIERLPRALQATYPSSEERLRAGLAPEQCFLVATTRDEEPEVIGYLSMRGDQAYKIGHVQDIVISRTYRRHQIATRLTKVAGLWAREHHLTSLMIETQTKNYPAIRFCEGAGFNFCGFNDRYFPNRDIAVFFSQSVR
jgi:ribosomal protein S18 acetylase RimI-like enzyme